MISEGVPLCLDWRDLCADLPDESVDLLFLDPPYNIGKFCKMPAGEYLDWCGEWIAEGSRVLAPNGAFWVSHNMPEVLVDISREIARHGRKRINWVTWDKYNGAGPGMQFVMNKTKLHPQGKRAWDHDAEWLVYHADEGAWMAQCDRERGLIFEPLRAYLDGERQRAGISIKQCADALGVSKTMCSQHYFSNSQWGLPTVVAYNRLRTLVNSRANGSGEYLRREYEDLRREYEDLRHEYEDLRREYEDLRYTFNNPGRVSSVWQIPPAKRNGHPTPKPEALLERILEATSNPGDLVLDFFAGSFTTAAVAQRLGRRWICTDIEPRFVEIGRKRLAEPEQLAMAGMGE